MRMEEILNRRQIELGRKPETVWARWFGYTDWAWIMFCSCLVLAVAAYSISVLLPVLAK